MLCSNYFQNFTKNKVVNSKNGKSSLTYLTYDNKSIDQDSIYNKLRTNKNFFFIPPFDNRQVSSD